MLGDPSRFPCVRQATLVTQIKIISEHNETLFNLDCYAVESNGLWLRR